MPKEPTFTNVNFSVCLYCRNLMVHDPHVASISVGDEYGCKVRTGPDGKYGNIRHKEKGDALWLIERGCERFGSSGLPAYPTVHEELIRINPLARSIPSDEGARETSWDFGAKLKRYLPQENFLKHANQIQNRS